MGSVDIAVTKILGMVLLPSATIDNQGNPVGVIIGRREEAFIREFNIRLEHVLEEGEEVLGTYRHMQSPGVITLYWENIGQLFWQIALDINRAGYYMEKLDFERMAHMAVLKTYTHEQFHHFCDVARHLFGRSYDRLKEEALAVAWSYRQVQEQRKSWQSKEARLSSPFYYELMRRMYRYTGTGYFDWIKYQTEEDFIKEVSSYLGPTSTVSLEANGIDIGKVLLAVLNEVKDKAVLEEVI